VGIKLKRKKSDRAASDVLEDAVRRYQTDTVTVSELMHALHERGFGILLIIFVLPNCVPIPTPGFVSLTAIPLFLVAWQMIQGRDYPWVPSWLGRKTIRRTLLAKLVEAAAPRMKRIEKILRARMAFAASETGEKLIGLWSIPLIISIAIPLPWTNFLPGCGILVMALGLLSRDGVVIIIGGLIGLAGLALTTAILIFGTEVIKFLIG
jgi:hypothetical protein